MLAELDRGFLEALRKIRSDPEIADWLISPSVHITAEEQERWYINYLADDTIRILVLVEGGKVQGYGQLRHIDTLHWSAELGVVVATGAGGKGRGTAITKGLIELSEALGIHRLWLTVFQDNAKAMGMYLKCGFGVEGLLRDAVLKDGEFKNLCVMARINDA